MGTAESARWICDMRACQRMPPTQVHISLSSRSSPRASRCLRLLAAAASLAADRAARSAPPASSQVRRKVRRVSPADLLASRVTDSAIHRVCQRTLANGALFQILWAVLVLRRGGRRISVPGPATYAKEQLAGDSRIRG